MNTLKYTLSLFAILFISTSLYAFSTNDIQTNHCQDSTLKERSEVSMVSALSLFSFISLTEETNDSAKVHDSRIVELIDLIQTYL